MSMDSQRYLEHVFLINPLTEDWYVGLYDNIGDGPDIALPDCEVTRVLFSDYAYYVSGYIANTTQVQFGPLPTRTIKGIFLVNGLTSTEAMYWYDLSGPINVESGDFIRFAAGNIRIWL